MTYIQFALGQSVHIWNGSSQHHRAYLQPRALHFTRAYRHTCSHGHFISHEQQETFKGSKVPLTKKKKRYLTVQIDTNAGNIHMLKMSSSESSFQEFPSSEPSGPIDR